MNFVNVNRRQVCLLGLAALGSGRVSAQADPGVDALHALNRLAYGPAPVDIGHVMQIGVERYIDEQLHPERLLLPPALMQQLDALDTTRWLQRELIRQFREAQQSARNDSEEGKAQRREFYQRLTLQAGEARLLRALQSPAQLQEVMVDFWFNHFNVFIGKGLDRALVENYEREAIRPYAMGRFGDLLRATAHHPAMLFYLDNWQSVAAGYRQPGATGPAAKASGLNENYARELMELHTLGVDGGYAQADVTELARMLTGWTFNARAGAGDSAFYFDAKRHDNGEKQWLGRRVAGRGQSEGEEALDVLAMHPATARRIGYKLAQYFVSDEPPPALVERLSRRFLDTGGDIRAVLKTLFDSAEFRAPRSVAAKFKTPYRYLVSAVRASGIAVSNVRPLVATAYQLGMPLYGCQTPDGYKNTEVAWLNPEAITRRINFANAFASGRLPFARPMDDTEAVGMGKSALQRAVDRASTARFNPAWATPPIDVDVVLGVLGSGISARTRDAVAQADPGLRAALVLGSPDFMHF
jgi:uncharacterized protein (DUF1800 family)